MDRRVIKFRAWDLGTKKMVQWEGILSNIPPGKEMMPGYDPLNNDRLLIPMEFIGIFDKNGKEIYEGDIYRFTIKVWNNDYPPTYRKIEITRLLSKGEYWDDHDISYFGFMLEVDSKDIEVIGNMYENPDLLKDTEK